MVRIFYVRPTYTLQYKNKIDARIKNAQKVIRPKESFTCNYFTFEVELRLTIEPRTPNS